MYQKEVTVKNKAGLHARPSALIAKIANKYKSDIIIKTNYGEQGNAKSFMGVNCLAITYDTKIIIKAEGEDEVEAVEDLIKLIENKCGEG